MICVVVDEVLKSKGTVKVDDGVFVLDSEC